MTAVGAQLATGRTADIFAYGTGSVVKVLRTDVPARWATVEFELAIKIHGLDLRTPEPREVTTVDGRAAVVFERVDGPSLQSAMIVGDMSVPDAAALLAEIHQEVLGCSPPAHMPEAATRLAVKIAAVDVIGQEERREGQRIVEGLPTAKRLLHGDMHPNNVILSGSGPVIIDWFDASVGHPVADIARSKLLMRSPDTELERGLADDSGSGLVYAPHLPGATIELLDEFRGCYLSAMSPVLNDSGVDERTWQNFLAVAALGRVAEQVRPDDGPLLAIWRNRPEPASS